MKFKRAAILTGMTAAGICVPAYTYLDLPPHLVPEMMMRSSRTFWAGILVSIDYKRLPDDDGSEEFRQKRQLVHQRSADRMLDVCRKNTGIYTKAGQHIASLNYIVPKEYTKTLGVLTDKAPFMSMDEVDGVLTKELGPDWRSQFREFDEKPIAAASLAQVHTGVLTDGQRVAIKVQFPSVSRQLKMDLATITLCVRIVGYLFPKFQFTWILPEFKQYLGEELDFRKEVSNNKRIRAHFANNPQFSTPTIIDRLCTKRVLVMEFIDGCKMTDVKAIQAMGFRPEDVSQLIMENFAEQVFVAGFLHSDPHSANAFVRPVEVGGRSKPQLVLLDHGLYRELGEDFRDKYAHLWRALVTRDPQGIEKYARALGAGDWFKVFAFILTFRPVANTNTGLTGKLTRADIELVKKEWEEADPNISKLLESLDRQLLLVLRTANILRSINIELGGKVNRYQVNARAALKGIHLRSGALTGKATLKQKMGYWWDLFNLELTFALAGLSSWVASVLRRIMFWSASSDELGISLGERV